MTLAPDDPRHGWNSGHVAGCREPCCKQAKLRYDKQRKRELAVTGRARRVPAFGYLRRLHALQANGLSFPQIAAADPELKVLTLSSKGVQTRNVVLRSNFEAMDRAYKKLCMVVPEGCYPERSRRAAARKGWARPLCWDDGTGPHGIDNPDATPHDVQRPIEEKKPAPGRRFIHADEVEQFYRGGDSLDQITAALGYHRDSIYRALIRQGREDLWNALLGRQILQAATVSDEVAA